MGHPAVVEAAVIGIPDQRWDERPLAFVVVARRRRRSTAADLADVPRRPGRQWQVPESWTFVDEIPKTSVGKFDKKPLRARFASGEITVTRTI